MNRWIFDTNKARENLIPGEFILNNQDGVRIDDGDTKTAFVNGELMLTSHRLIWTNRTVIASDLVLPLGLAIFAEEEDGRGILKTEKIALHLSPPPPNPPRGPVSSSKYDFIRLAFKMGGMKSFLSKLREAIAQRRWEVMVAPRPRPQTAQKKLRSGIGGIEKSMQQKARQTDKEISKAFQDLDKLMEMAKPMVALANNISKKIRDKQGDVSDDETVRFKSYLMNLGISDPVTRDTHGSGQEYFMQLANEITRVLEKPVRESGGMTTLTDAFVRLNRARGLELLSTEDMLNACQCLDKTKSSLRLHEFETTGVKVLQLRTASVCDDFTLKKTEDAVNQTGSLTAEELARVAGIAVVLAKERLLAAETAGRLCRDDSIQGLRFYPNLFLTKT